MVRYALGIGRATALIRYRGFFYLLGIFLVSPSSRQPTSGYGISFTNLGSFSLHQTNHLRKGNMTEEKRLQARARLLCRVHIIENVYNASSTVSRSTPNTARRVAADIRFHRSSLFAPCAMYATIATVKATIDHTRRVGGRLRRMACPGMPNVLCCMLCM